MQVSCIRAAANSRRSWPPPWLPSLRRAQCEAAGATLGKLVDENSELADKLNWQAGEIGRLRSALQRWEVRGRAGAGLADDCAAGWLRAICPANGFEWAWLDAGVM